VFGELLELELPGWMAVMRPVVVEMVRVLCGMGSGEVGRMRVALWNMVMWSGSRAVMVMVGGMGTWISAYSTVKTVDWYLLIQIG
jgi:hypothetical protein